MRSDVTLYVVAAFFFVLTIASAVIFQQEERSLWMVSTAVIGILSLSLGVYQRPKTKSTTQKTQTVTQSTQQEVISSQTASIQTEAQTEQVPTIDTAASEIVQTIESPIEPSAQETSMEKTPVTVVQTETASVEAAYSNA